MRLAKDQLQGRVEFRPQQLDLGVGEARFRSFVGLSIPTHGLTRYRGGDRGALTDGPSFPARPWIGAASAK